MTETLLMAGRLCQQALVYRDCLPGRAVPAELLRSLQAGPAPALSVARHRQRRLAESGRITVGDEHAGVADDLGDARVAEGRHRASAGHRLEARQSEPLVAAWEDKAARGRVEVGQRLVIDPPQLDRAVHGRGRLASRSAGDHELEVR